MERAEERKNEKEERTQSRENGCRKESNGSARKEGVVAASDAEWYMEEAGKRAEQFVVKERTESEAHGRAKER